ncbi:MAG: hypothetical protein QOG54_630 [Actinomycetota bacterium]|jgi:hypothetical protein|nr:hypothetical protein [Actinomycetota bacterium]
MRLGRGLRRSLRRARRAGAGDPFARRGVAAALPTCPVGLCFDETDFSDGGGGIAAGFEGAGPRDFPQGGYELTVVDGIQVCRIDPSAPTNGDAGILRTYEAAEGQEYSVTALARIRDASPGFKARLTISPKQANGRQLGEFNARLDQPGDEFTTMEIPSAVMPPGTTMVSVKFRAHNKAPGDAGTAELKQFRFERLR